MNTKLTATELSEALDKLREALEEAESLMGPLLRAIPEDYQRELDILRKGKRTQDQLRSEMRRETKQALYAAYYGLDDHDPVPYNHILIVAEALGIPPSEMKWYRR